MSRHKPLKSLGDWIGTGGHGFDGSLLNGDDGTAVSYTHLPELAHRQQDFGIDAIQHHHRPVVGVAGTARLVDLVDADPVSYTHLDVYKRQGTGRLSWVCINEPTSS